MNNLLVKGARWTLAVLAALILIAVGIWFLPIHVAIKVIGTILVVLVFVMALLFFLFAPGPQG